MDKYLYVAATLAFTVYGQLMLKWRATVHAGQPGNYLFAMYTDIGVLSGLACGVAASVSWSLALQQLPLSTAYPLTALSFVLVPLASVLLLRDGLAPVQLLGLALIVVGISLSAFGR